MVLLTLMLALLASPQGPASPHAAQGDALSLFNQGTEWTPWFAGVRVQRATWETVAQQAATPPTEMVDRFRKSGAGLKLLVVADEACSDSMQTVPHIAALAAAAGIELRIVSKDAAATAIDHHRTPDNRTATPTVIFLRDGKDAGAWVERPEPLQTWFLASAALSRQDRLSRKTSWYQWDRGATTLAEIVAIAERR
jgi:hypothetical protein